MTRHRLILLLFILAALAVILACGTPGLVSWPGPDGPCYSTLQAHCYDALMEMEP